MLKGGDDDNNEWRKSEKQVLQQQLRGIIGVKSGIALDRPSIKIALMEYYDEFVKIICADGLKRHCYSIPCAGVIIYYKKQVFIIEIKSDV